MPTFYNYRENGGTYSFDDVFVPADAFRQGNTWTWGRGDDGRLGNNTTTDKQTPVTTFSGGANWKQISCGFNHVAAIKTDGTLWTWGDNTGGQIGDNTSGSTLDRLTPVTTFVGGTNWKQVSCGYRHTAAIKTDGTLWIWGSGGNGRLGNNATTNKLTPVQTFLEGTNWKQVACGGFHTAAIKTDGTLWTWGDNTSGQIGDNTSGTNRLTPVTTFLGGNTWKQVSCATGAAHTAAIKTDGTLWNWGQNVDGQLGDNTIINRSTPIQTLLGGTNWKQVSCGDSHTAAIKTDGTLWTWGSDVRGELGINSGTIDISTPVTTFAGGTNWKQVSCSKTHTTAIKTDGTLWTWGWNFYGELGDNTQNEIVTPVTTFAGRTNWKQVSAGREFTAAITYIDDYQ
jgi:alpha-tubulin suppressor-like RCC1 family protein